ncbi:DUF3040 domain-containing protein [Lipingzhangella sp. LS1_29]|uniref:DUF3040 domain-containing protein n=1 Tax=Lipingzhangella rawalii TaxID=2055835 RepID=A0ABU2H1I3_9ACTN|nr:DUF3040 domain-containing protein [Lipingzhangella rawalii]MDS1269170.1 DUF3040 domain-containing protein [Lipingzhangella rawalii]
MALRENERRILSEIAHRLSEEDPTLAQQLASFTADDPQGQLPHEYTPRAQTRRWVWAGVAAGLALIVALLVVLMLISAPAG